MGSEAGTRNAIVNGPLPFVVLKGTQPNPSLKELRTLCPVGGKGKGDNELERKKGVIVICKIQDLVMSRTRVLWGCWGHRSTLQNGGGLRKQNKKGGK